MAAPKVLTEQQETTMRVLLDSFLPSDRAERIAQARAQDRAGNPVPHRISALVYALRSLQKGDAETATTNGNGNKLVVLLHKRPHPNGRAKVDGRPQMAHRIPVLPPGQTPQIPVDQLGTTIKPCNDAFADWLGGILDLRVEDCATCTASAYDQLEKQALDVPERLTDQEPTERIVIRRLRLWLCCRFKTLPTINEIHRESYVWCDLDPYEKRWTMTLAARGQRINTGNFQRRVIVGLGDCHIYERLQRIKNYRRGYGNGCVHGSTEEQKSQADEKEEGRADEEESTD